MATLDRWRSYASTPKTLVFPKLELIGRDFEPILVSGAGEVHIGGSNSFTFKLTGTPADISYTSAELRRQGENPYDLLARPRLRGIDSDGIEWSGGYTVPIAGTTGNVWTFTGTINGLTTLDLSSTVSVQSGAELIYPLRVGDSMTLAVTWLPTVNPAGTSPSREHTIEVLGSTIHFAFEDTGTLLITATQSPELSPPYAENWLSEPLRILFGQLIYPSLVARNFGNGRAQIQLHRVPDFIRGAQWAALAEASELTLQNHTVWDQYAQLLAIIARARTKDGTPNFEPHKLTRLYEEVIQAALGSRWVWALTFASSIEGLAKMLKPRDAKPVKGDSEAIDALVEHIKSWRGNTRLKESAIAAVHRTADLTAVRILRALSADGVITEPQLTTWKMIRDEVMHGNLIPPYSSEGGDGQLVSLSNMMQSLTRELLRRSE